MEASQHRTISPEVFRAFREAKDTFFDLVAQQQMLPKEYETCLQHVHETIDEIQHYETQCSSMSEITTIGYITAVLVFDINHCLQNLHDIAENRVIRGSHLTEAEINFIVEITDLYNFFLLELFPSLGLNPIESLVDLTPVATAQAASRPRQLNKVFKSPSFRLTTLRHVGYIDYSQADYLGRRRPQLPRTPGPSTDQVEPHASGPDDAATQRGVAPSTLPPPQARRVFVHFSLDVGCHFSLSLPAGAHPARDGCQNAQAYQEAALPLPHEPAPHLHGKSGHV